MTESIRVGLIGAGTNTRVRHIPGLQAVEGVEIVAVANRSRESGQRVADEYGIAQVYDRWADLLAAPDVDAVCIGTWPYMHKILVLAALEQEKHVLTEARLAMNAAEARDMLAAARHKPNLVTQVVPAPFTLEVDRTVQDLIAEGYAGDVLAVDAAVGSAFIDPDAPFMWRHDRNLSGYNIMLTGAWYECLTRLLGPATSVTAVTRVNVPARLDSSGTRRIITVPDQVEVLYELSSSSIVHLRVSEVTGLAPRDAVWIWGTGGTLQIEVVNNGEAAYLRGGRKGDSSLSPIDIPPERKGGWRVEEEFINAIRGLEPVTHNTFETGVQYMEFTEGLTRSAQTRKTVYLPL